MALFFCSGATVFVLLQGKSLSIICGALKWLLDREQKDKSILTAVLEGRLPPSSTAAATLPQFQNASVQPSSVMETTKKEPDWFALFDQKKAEKETLQKVRDEVERKERCKASLKKLKEEHAAAARWKAKRKVLDSYFVCQGEGVGSGGGVYAIKNQRKCYIMCLHVITCSERPLPPLLRLEEQLLV